MFTHNLYFLTCKYPRTYFNDWHDVIIGQSKQMKAVNGTAIMTCSNYVTCLHLYTCMYVYIDTYA